MGKGPGLQVSWCSVIEVLQVRMGGYETLDAELAVKVSLRKCCRLLLPDLWYLSFSLLSTI